MDLTAPGVGDSPGSGTRTVSLSYSQVGVPVGKH